MDINILKSNDSTLLKIKSEKIFSDILAKINEVELENIKGETYRFLVLGPWGNSSIHRLNKTSDKITLVSKNYWSEINDIQIDSLGKETIINLTIKDWNAIKNSLDEINYWKSPVIIDDNDYLDGTIFAIEGYSTLKNDCTNRNYHATSRVSPNDTTLYSMIFDKVHELAPKKTWYNNGYN